MLHRTSLHALALLLALTITGTSFAPKRVNKKEQLHKQLKKLRYLNSESSFSDIEKEQKESARVLRAMELTPRSAAAYRTHVNGSIKKNRRHHIGTQIKRIACHAVGWPLGIGGSMCGLLWAAFAYASTIDAHAAIPMYKAMFCGTIMLYFVPTVLEYNEEYTDIGSKLRAIMNAQTTIADQLDAKQ